MTAAYTLRRSVQLRHPRPNAGVNWKTLCCRIGRSACGTSAEQRGGRDVGGQQEAAAPGQCQPAV